MLSRAALTPARLVDEAECVASVLLAIALAHRVGVPNIAWAAFSGYMVMRGHVADTLVRGARRIAGSALGAALAIALVPTVSRSLVASSVAIAAIGGLTLYGAILARHAYAWLFLGLTFEMVLLERLADPGFSAAGFAADRLIEVGIGTGACVVVSLASAVTARRRWPATRAAPPPLARYHPDAARHAGQCAVALAVLPLIEAWRPLPYLDQSGVTIFAAMIVPLAGLGHGALVPVSRRLVYRVAGCLAGAVLALAVLLVARGEIVLSIAGLALGVAIGRHIENGPHAAGYVGTQFTLAVLVTLVPDSLASAGIAPALARLGGILIGVAVLEPVLIAWHLLAPRPGVIAPPAPVPSREPGE